MLTSGGSSAFVEGGARIFLPIWRLRQDGPHAYSPGGGEPDVLDGRAATAWKLRMDQNAKTAAKPICEAAADDK